MTTLTCLNSETSGRDASLVHATGASVQPAASARPGSASGHRSRSGHIRARLACTFLVGGLALGAWGARPLAAAPLEAIDARHVVDSATNESWGEATATLDVPYAELLTSLRDYPHYADFFPHVSTSKVLAQQKGKALLYLEAGLLQGAYKIWAQVMLKEQARADGGTNVIAQMKEGNVSDFRARWVLTPLDEGRRSQLSFRIFLAPKLPVPSALVDKENVKAAKRAIRALVEFTRARQTSA